MGIRGLETFIRKTFHELENIKFHNCNDVIDSDSIYHQMYQECELRQVFFCKVFYYECSVCFSQ
jgi:hypothetical protein